MRSATASAAACFTGASLWTNPEISITRLICDTYLQSNGLALGDRLSMASSVEARSPLVDYRLAEVVIGLRKAGSDLHLGHKAWLKSVLSELVPPFVLNRRKRGFTPPWRTWTRALMDRYGDDMARGILVEQGFIRADAAQRFRRGFDWLGCPMPFAFETLVLEQWARGLHQLGQDAIAAQSRAIGEPDLRGSRSQPVHA